MNNLLPKIIIVLLILSFNACFRSGPEIPSSSIKFPQLPPGINKPWDIKNLLKHEEFVELNSRMEKIQNRFEQNFIYEFEMFDFYNFLYIQDESFQKYFDNWVKLFPDNWQSRIARANYFYAMGWKSRGHKYARDTSPEQFRMMERYFDQSLKDIVRALQLNKKLLYAYSIYIGIQKNYSNDAYNIDAIDQVLTMYPESYKIREIFMTDLFPRWGGSHKKMFSFAKESEKYSSKNPLLRVLMGYIYYDKGRYAEEGENFKLAEECYCNALKFGECWNFLNLRASLYYYNLDNPEKALIDVNRCLQIEPYNVSSLSLRAKIFFGLNKEKEALNDIQTAQQIKDNDESITRLKKWASQHYVIKGFDLSKTNITEALKYYSKAEEIYSNNAKIYYWRGDAYAKLNKFSQSFSEMKKAISLDPKYYDAYAYIDWLLAHEGRWSEIVSYWNSYIALVPDDANAYFERGGTYYHLKDMKAAYYNAKKACDLGHEEACQMAERFKDYK